MGSYIPDARTGPLLVSVHEDNIRARTAYHRRGYLLTRHSAPYVLDKSRRELEMIKQL